MARIPEYPPLLCGSTSNQVIQMRDYLMRLVKAMEDDGMYADKKSSGGSIEVDDVMDITSENPVQNKVITAALLLKADTEDLADVATSGDYDDLINAPALADVATSGDYDDLTGKPYLSTVATSGSYTDLTSKPSINLIPLSGNKQPAELGLATTQHVHTKSQITDFPSLAVVATSGSYNDLSNRPVIPPGVIVDTEMSDSSENAVQNKVIKLYVDSSVPSEYLKDASVSGNTLTIEFNDGSELQFTPTGGGGGTTDYNLLSNKPSINSVSLSGNKQASDLGLASSSHDHTVSQITDFPSLAVVATSGSYNDLTGKPSLAAVATSGAYSDLSGKPSLSSVATSGSYADLSSKPSINFVSLSGNKQPAELGLATTSHTHTKSQITDFPAIPGYVVETKTASINCSANAVTDLSLNCTKSGYTPMGLVGFYLANKGALNMRTWYFGGSTLYYTIHNSYGQAFTDTVYLYILYSKN